MSNRRVFEYQERTKEQYDERATGSGSREKILKNGFKIFTPREGNNKIRILPPTWEKAKHYGLDLWTHYNIGRDNSSYLCLLKMKGDRCPVCEEVEKNIDKAYTDTIKAKKKILMWVIDRNDEKTGPQLFLMPPKMDRNFVLQSSEEDTGELYFIDHPVKGFDISFRREGTGLATRYDGEKISRVKKELSTNPEEMSAWMDYIMDNPVPETLVWKDCNYIKKVFHGGTAALDEDDDTLVEEATVGVIKNDTPTFNRDDYEEKLIEKFGLKVKEVKYLSDEEIIKKYNELENSDSRVTKLEEVQKRLGKRE